MDQEFNFHDDLFNDLTPVKRDYDIEPSASIVESSGKRRKGCVPIPEDIHYYGTTVTSPIYYLPDSPSIVVLGVVTYLPDVNPYRLSATRKASQDRLEILRESLNAYVVTMGTPQGTPDELEWLNTVIDHDKHISHPFVKKGEAQDLINHFLNYGKPVDIVLLEYKNVYLEKC